tara:strand:+ start:1155 stop:1322 length:168 start_codon:yes stop_codon:yes gene_type:complete
MNKYIPHPASVKYITSVMTTQVAKEPQSPCSHPFDIIYWFKGGFKCQGCGEIIII